MLTTMLQQIGRSNPELLSIISQVTYFVHTLFVVIDFSSEPRGVHPDDQ